MVEKMLFVAWVVCAAFIFKLFWNVSTAFDAAVERLQKKERSPYEIMPQLEVGLLAIALALYWSAGAFPFNLGFLSALAIGLGLIVASYLLIFPAQFVFYHVLRWWRPS